MNRCEAVEDSCISGDDALRKHRELVASSWQLEGNSPPSPIMMAGVRMTHWEDEGEPSYREKLFQVFSKIDKDRDGNITRDELRQYCEGDQMEDAIKALGINQDGTISFEEFYERFKKVTPMLDSVTPQPISSTPQHNMAQSYVLEAGEEETLEWESIMRKFSIDSDSPLFQSKELRELIMRMEHQSPHLLDTMEQVISFLHADWQQLKRDCDNLNNKLKRESHQTVEQAMEYDETLQEQLEKEREAFVNKEHQLKTKLNKQLREKEDYILQVLAQKRKLEEQLNVKEKEKVSLQQHYKELESVVNHRQRPVESTSARSTPVHRRHAGLGPAKSSECFEKSNFSHKLTSRSNTVETSFSDQEEMCDNTTVSFELSTQLLVPSDTPQGYQIPNKSRSAISLAEEFEQLDHQSDTPPVILQLPSEMLHDSSSTHVTSDALPGDTTSTEWSPLVGQSPLMSPSTNSGHLSSSSSESPIPMITQVTYRSHEPKEPSVGSHGHQRPPASQETGSHGPHNRESPDQVKASHDPAAYDVYVKDSFSCPNLSTLDHYGKSQRLGHFSGDGQSAIWDERYHDNCASMANIHLDPGTAHDYRSNHYASNIGATPNTLSPVVEESSPSANPPSHVYKVVYLGNSGVGKSSVIRWLSTGSFQSATEATIGMDYITRTITVDNEPVLLQLWDTAGQERFGPITAVYCRRADAFILVYDITNRSSFVGIKGWTDVIKATLRDESSVLLLIGNKRDVSHGEREVSSREGEKLAEQLGAIFMETSARSGNNVIQAHKELARRLLEREDEIMNEARQPATVYINAVTSLNKKKCFC